MNGDSIITTRKEPRMNLRQKSCKPCEKGGRPLDETAEDGLLQELSAWNIERSGVHYLIKRFSFGTFKEAVGFVNNLAFLAESEGHHPSIRIDYRTVSIELTTHAYKGLSENDFILAAKIDNIYSIA